MPAMPFSLIDGVLGQVTGEQAETALRTLAPGPDGTRRYREAYPAAGRRTVRTGQRRLADR